MAKAILQKASGEKTAQWKAYRMRSDNNLQLLPMQNAASIGSAWRFWSDGCSTIWTSATAWRIRCMWMLSQASENCVCVCARVCVSECFTSKTAFPFCFYAIFIWPAHRLAWRSQWMLLFSTSIYSFFLSYLFSGYCIATVSQMAVRKWLHIYNMVSIGSH